MRHVSRMVAAATVMLLLVPVMSLAAPRYLFPHSQEMDPSPAFAPGTRDSSYIYYDDGTPYYYWTLAAGDRAAVRFTVPAPTEMDSAEVLSIQVMVYDATGPGNIRLHVWADDNGQPGADLMAPMTVTPTLYASPGQHLWNSFIDVRFEDQPNPGYQQVEQDIWIGYEFLSSAPNPLGDVATTTHRSYFYEGGSWAPVDDSDLMIRIWWGQDVPVEISSFSYEVAENGILLRWDTQSETENFGFRVVRSGDLLGPYAVVSELIPGAGTTIVPQHYEFFDTDVEWGNCYYYFLEDTDLSGISHRTGPLAAVFGTPVDPPLPTARLLDIAPNPVTEETRLTFRVADGTAFLNGNAEMAPQRVNLGLYDLQGRLTRRLYFGQVLPGTYHVTWDGTTDAGSASPAGVYLCRLEVGNRTDVTRVVLAR
ncbi:hypothetical protein JXA88_05715 [Candidatus Fermentibacteria bacterium]|nr:hypothetical protein [Candidatus Fermentibacteria bacterium]